MAGGRQFPTSTAWSGQRARNYSDQLTARDSELFLQHRRGLGGGAFQTIDQFQAELELARRRSLDDAEATGVGINSDMPVKAAGGAIPLHQQRERGSGTPTSSVDVTESLNRSLRRFGFNETEARTRARALATHDIEEEQRTRSPARSGDAFAGVAGGQGRQPRSSSTEAQLGFGVPLDRQDEDVGPGATVAVPVTDSVAAASVLPLAEVVTASPVRSPGGSRYEFYAVYRGRAPGIYRHWSVASLQVTGFSGNNYRGFRTLREAVESMRVAGYDASGEGAVGATK